MTTTIISDSGWWKATLDVRDDGVHVAFWHYDGAGWSRRHRDVLHAPLHAVRDEVSIRVNQLKREVWTK
jgi:hypothetical protein